MNRSEPRIDLAELIERQRDAIAARWGRLLVEIPGSHYHEISGEEIDAWTRRGLDAFAASLRSQTTDALDEHARAVSETRRSEGFGVGEVVEALLLLRDILTPMLLERAGKRLAWAGERLALVDATLRRVLSRFAQHFAETMLLESRSLQRLSAALLDRQGLAEMLEIIAEEACSMTGARGSAVAFQGEDGGLNVAYRHGQVPYSARQLEELLELGERDKLPAKTRVFHSLPPSVVEGGGPLVCNLMATPLRQRGQVNGLLLLVDKPGAFDDADRRGIGLLADQGAVAVEHARLHRQHERLAVLEERQRLARDLHDSVTQSLYGMTLSAEASTRLLEGGDVSAALEALRELKTASLNALREIRLLVFELRPAVLEQDGLAAALRSRLRAVEERSGVTTSLRTSRIGRLAREIEEGLHGIALEALNNALRHAHPQRIGVILERGEDTIQLRIDDDGRGFDPQEGCSSGGLGLRGMRERAERLGACLSIVSAPGEGTAIGVVVPSHSGE